MSNYSEVKLCSQDDGLDYIFAKMGAIYGSQFIKHWDGVDHNLVRTVWKEALGRAITYKQTMDWALKHMNPDYPPSALAFAKLCKESPDQIPLKPSNTITHQPTQEEINRWAKEKAEAMEFIKNFGKVK